MDYRLNRWEGYKEYHRLMLEVGDCDPAYPAMRYLADRFELNLEQRYWLAWLYSISYCVPTAYYMLSEFPDYENVDNRRLEKWWNSNKSRCLFQTDRAKVKNFDKIVPMFLSYRQMMGDSQDRTYRKMLLESPETSYNSVYASLSDLYYFGRYSLFLLLESVHEIAGLYIRPTGLNLKEAESCRNGLIYACGKDNWIQKKKHNQPIPEEGYRFLDAKLKQLYDELTSENRDLEITYWNIETTLCAYKKLFWNTRYFGYYIDRQMEEIITMQNKVREGVDWSVLWDFRREYFGRSMLGEYGGWRGVRTKLFTLVTKTGRITEALPEKHKNPKFQGSDKAYELTDIALSI